MRRARGRAGWTGLAIAALFAGCSGERSAATEDRQIPDVASADSAQYETREPVGPATDLPANELGKIMVLEYHRLGTPEGEWYRSLENFKADLQRLYDAGYRPVTVKQMVQGDLDVPRGTTPVVFTFDDSSQGQFYLLEDGSVDPNSMVGVWENFRETHPGWDGGATWCVLPGADFPSNFFGERPRTEVPREERERRIKQKVDLLLERGHEICNHTLYHARLDRAKDDLQAQEWIGRGDDSIRVYLPEDYDISTFALPLGMWPKNRQLAVQGTYNGKSYEYNAVLEVTGGPNVSPFDRTFDPTSIDRVVVAPNHLERLIESFRKDPSDRYVSDGDLRSITVPSALAGSVDVDRWPDREVRTHDLPIPAPAGSPVTPAPPEGATAAPNTAGEGS